MLRRTGYLLYCTPSSLPGETAMLRSIATCVAGGILLITDKTEKWERNKKWERTVFF